MNRNLVLVWTHRDWYNMPETDLKAKFKESNFVGTIAEAKQRLAEGENDRWEALGARTNGEWVI